MVSTLTAWLRQRRDSDGWLLPTLVSLIGMGCAFALGLKMFRANDTAQYIQMLSGGGQAPWAYRILAVGIVKLLPFSVEINFFLLTWFSTLGTLLASYALFRAFGISIVPAIVTLFCLSVSFPLAFYLGTWGLIDPLANLFFVLGLYCIHERRYARAAVVIAVGVLAKETLLILLPLFWLRRIRERAPRAEWARDALSVAVVSALPLASFVLLRLLVHPVPGTLDIRNYDDLVRLWQVIWSYNTEGWGIVIRVGRELLRSYGLFWVTAFFGLLLQRKWRVECLYLIAAGFLLCTVAVDWSRMLATTFPGVFIPVAVFFEGIWRSNRQRTGVVVFLVTAAIVQCYLSLQAYASLDALGQTILVAGILAIFVLGALGSAYGFLGLRQPVMEHGG